MKLEIPDVPPSLNKVLNMHWRTKRKLQSDWAWLVLAATNKQQRIELKYSLVKKRVRITLHHSRLYDTDNAYGACKVLFDALKNNGFLVDDNELWLLSTVEQEKCPHKKRHTIIDMEDSMSNEPVVDELSKLGMDYRYDAVQFASNGWMVHRRWNDEYGGKHMDEASLYGDYTEETAIKAAIKRGSWA